ncbi:class I SAM-dependent DNA methyltransferase [Peptoniphilus sp.]|uniref:class I SAM-dependent DNA methyltransferase n=1 Tax=Peptoniphilus sp. TaxID=1971214 RepID=UPI0039961CD1
MYKGFAYIYDELMYDLDYEGFSKFIREKLNGKKSVLDMGCGTGTMVKLLEDEFKIDGFDLSPDMLSVAKNKVKGDLFCLDMRDFDMHKKYDAIISSGDSLSYILDTEELRDVFKNVSNNLKTDGIFIFDLNTFYKFQSMEEVYIDETENVFYIWENFFDEEERLNYYDINFFVREENGTYRRFTENHVECAHDIETVKNYLKECGFRVELYDNYTEGGGIDTAKRVTFVCYGENL